MPEYSYSTATPILPISSAMSTIVQMGS